LVNALLYHCKGALSDAQGPLRRGIVHRLDKNTPGLLVVAKTNEAHEHLAEQFAQKSAARRYLAVVLGEVKEDFGTIDAPISRSIGETVKMRVDFSSIQAKPARTHFRTLERFSGATFLEVELETGRTHQIRVHFAHSGHPVFGDELYGSRGFHKFSKIKTNQQVLQSTFLRFTHPENSEIMEFTLPNEKWDGDLLKVLKFLRMQ
jgi:23S rRNA pseudouridine1911/1915/1917 synthase